MEQKGMEQYPRPFTIGIAWKEVCLHDTTAWVECESAWRKPDRITAPLTRSASYQFAIHIYPVCLLFFHMTSPMSSSRSSSYATTSSDRTAKK